MSKNVEHSSEKTPRELMERFTEFHTSSDIFLFYALHCNNFVIIVVRTIIIIIIVTFLNVAQFPYACSVALHRRSKTIYYGFRIGS